MKAVRCVRMLLLLLTLWAVAARLQADEPPCQAISAGAGRDGATGSVLNAGQGVIGRTTSPAVTLHAGVIPCLALGSLAVPGDCSGNRAIDLTDVPELDTCLDGPAAPIAPSCQCADSNRDGHVDLADVARFQRQFGE